MFLRITSILLICVVAICAASTTKQLLRPKLDGKIIGGNKTCIEKYPYQASLIYRNNHICGGALVSPDTVLTAAHCTNGKTLKHFSIRAGSSTINADGIVVKVKKIIQHEDFDQQTFDYDISVLKLEKRLKKSASINFVDLPRSNQHVAPGVKSVCSGWGLDKSGGNLSEVLQVVELSIVDRKLCNASYEGEINDNMLCAGNIEEGGVDSCQGDSGGPLVAAGKLIGLVSWGRGCALPKYPGVYTDVSAMRSFIRKYGKL